jgi:hypothetical protein
MQGTNGYVDRTKIMKLLSKGLMAGVPAGYVCTRPGFVTKG